MAEYKEKDFSGLLGAPGLSDTLLKNHFILYKGYVANTNKVAGRLAELAGKGETGTPEYAELKRRFGWEFDGMRLHEYYFQNLAKGGKPLQDSMGAAKKIKEEFGSYEAWEKEFKAMGAIRGIGWAALYYDPKGDRLFNVWVSEHDGGHPAACQLLLIMDMWEHAFLTDYGLKKPDYIAAFLKNADWEAVQHRFERAPKAVCCK